ncbi:MAG TPA: class I SAM-dependent methyltransferase [Hyphomicrobiaceae bacterium]|nr:class I SAM-dependent methyltransferase [Hyphomicrobiaceae bacterium]
MRAPEEHERRPERFDERYREPGYHYGTEPNEFLKGQRHLLRQGQKALVPGDGEGRNGVWLARQGLEVLTFDLSAVGVEKAKRLAAERGVSIDARVGDVRTWPWPEACYDVIVLSFLHFLPDVREATHAAVWQALKPGGIVILEAFGPKQLQMRKRGARGGPKILDHLCSVEMVRQDFPGAVFLVLEEVEVNFEGRTHHGRCSVCRAVARKPA